MMNIFNMINCRLVDPIPQPVPVLGEGNATLEEIREIE